MNIMNGSKSSERGLQLFAKCACILFASILRIAPFHSTRSELFLLNQKHRFHKFFFTIFSFLPCVKYIPNYYIIKRIYSNSFLIDGFSFSFSWALDQITTCSISFHFFHSFLFPHIFSSLPLPFNPIEFFTHKLCFYFIN